jgi:hypothetical protein
MTCFIAERYSDAALWAHKTIEIRPEFPDGHRWLMTAAAMQGNLVEANEAFGAHHRLLPDYTIARAKDNQPLAEEAAERFLEALRKAGVPEQ